VTRHRTRTCSRPGPTISYENSSAPSSSPDRPALGGLLIPRSQSNHPLGLSESSATNVVATATAELDGTSRRASYGPPYSNAGEGYKLGPLALQKAGGVGNPVDSANDLGITPLRDVAPENATLADARHTWTAANPRSR
jgi:hypothetical protein